MFARRFTASVASAAIAVAGLGMAAVIAAGPASAGSVDDAFLNQLEQDGITPPSAQRAIKDAKAVCSALNKGYSADEVIDAVAESTGLNNDGANTFAVDAAMAYCPEFVEQT
jgi:predicted homoserine dehydrogenase-like protein